MFDPDLWRQTRASSIALIVLGAVLLAPAGYVFFLTGRLLTMGQIEIANSGEAAPLFWSAVIGSGTGCFAWISLCLLLMQRCNVGVHLVAWHLLRATGLIVLACTAVWLWLVLLDTTFMPLQGEEFRVLISILVTILFVGLLMLWTGHRNLVLTRAASDRLRSPDRSLGEGIPDRDS